MTRASSVKWIGYNNFKDVYTLEDFEEIQLGGYYTYDATLKNKVAVSGRVRAYWGENDEQTILDLKVMDPVNAYPIVEYNEQEIIKSWEIYQQKVGK